MLLKLFSSYKAILAQPIGSHSFNNLGVATAGHPGKNYNYPNILGNPSNLIIFQALQSFVQKLEEINVWSRTTVENFLSSNKDIYEADTFISSHREMGNKVIENVLLILSVKQICLEF